MKLFVYGTLLAGMSRDKSLVGTQRLGPACVGGELLDLGEYPGLVEGTGIVTGELHKIDGEVLRRLDEVEGCYPDDLARSLYFRKEVPARRFADGEEVRAVTYFYNRAKGTEATVACGDFRRHCARPKNGQILVIAYGSNLSPSRLAPRMQWLDPDTIAQKSAAAVPGYLEGFRCVCFGGKSATN